MFRYVADGIFQTQAEVDAHVQQTGKGIGRIWYKNMNGDNVINDEDRTWIGVSDPDFIYGLNIALDWKNFDCSMFWKGLVGYNVNNEVKRYTDFISFFGGHNDGGLLDPPGQVLARAGVQTGPGQGLGVSEVLGPQGVGQSSLICVYSLRAGTPA